MTFACRLLTLPTRIPACFCQDGIRAHCGGGGRGCEGEQGSGGVGGVRTAAWMEAEWEGNEIQSESLLLKAVFKSCCVIPPPV